MRDTQGRDHVIKGQMGGGKRSSKNHCYLLDDEGGNDE
jgi:hypothetical protein